MAVESSPAFLQANTYSAEVTRRAVYSPSFLRNAAGNIGSVTGGVCGIGADLVNSFPGSGMSVNTATGEALVPGSSVTTQSGYYFRNSSTTNTSIAASNPSNPRIDLVCCTVNDAQYTGALNTGVIQVVTGTPTAGATLSNLNGAPALPTSSLLLGYILVAANETNAITGSLNNIPIYLSSAPNPFATVAASGSGTVTALSGRHYIVSSGNTPFTLPAPFPGARVKVTNYGSGIPTVTQNASEKIYGLGLTSSGATTFSLGTFGATATCESDGTSWYITAGQQDTGWTALSTLTYINSWAASSGVTPAFRMVGNFVQFRGNVVSGSSGTAVTTSGVPTAMRPTATRYFPTADQAGSGTAELVSVGTGGVLIAYSTTSANGVSLEGIRYWMD